MGQESYTEIKENFGRFRKANSLKIDGINETLIARSFVTRSEKRYQTLANKVNSLNLKIERKIKNGAYDKAKSSTLERYIENREELKHLLSKLTSIRLFPQSFLMLKRFKTFKSCQLLIHEKGESRALNLIYHSKISAQQTFQEKNFLVSEFNKLCNLIKKSKTKSFDQGVIKFPCIETLGPFLAREFKFNKHTVIMIISRNGFLASTREEINFFELFTPLISPILKRLVLQDMASRNSMHLIYCLQSYPFPLSITNKTGNVIFQNQKKLELEEFLDGHKQSKYEKHVVEIDLRHYVHLWHPANNSEAALNFFHFQRISLLGELLNTLKHELGNPLFGLHLTTEIMSGETTDAEMKNSLRQISSNVQRCQNIIEDFSVLYRDTDDLDNFNVKKMLNEVLTLTKSETREIAQSIMFCNLKDDIVIKTNPTWFSQILFNLVINAAQSIRAREAQIDSDGGEIDKKISIEVDVVSNSFYEIRVVDNGVGVSNSHENILFQPFFTTKEKGNGLGLSICQNLAKRLGGKIFFYNNESGVGTTFYLQLPLDQKRSKKH